MLETAKDLGVEEPKLDRKQKVTPKLKDSIKPIRNYSSISEMHKDLYYQALETIISNIKNRFQQEGYEMVMNLENLLLKSANNQIYLELLVLVLQKVCEPVDWKS